MCAECFVDGFAAALLLELIVLVIYYAIKDFGKRR